MKIRAIIVSALCAAAVAVAAPAWAAKRSSAIEVKLESATAGGAAGIALLRTRQAGEQFSIRTSGLTPGVCEVKVGGTLEALLFVEMDGTGEILLDTKLYEKTIAGGSDLETDLGPLTFDPRGKTVQISRDGRILLEGNFPARPSVGR